jgi:hypothetical protein
VQGAVLGGSTRDTVHRAQRPLYNPYNVTNSKDLRRPGKHVAALIAPFGFGDARTPYLVQYGFQKALGYGLRLGYIAYLHRAAAIVFREFEDRSQGILAFLGNHLNSFYSIPIDKSTKAFVPCQPLFSSFLRQVILTPERAAEAGLSGAVFVVPGAVLMVDGFAERGLSLLACPRAMQKPSYFGTQSSGQLIPPGRGLKLWEFRGGDSQRSAR